MDSQVLFQQFRQAILMEFIGQFNGPVVGQGQEISPKRRNMRATKPAPRVAKANASKRAKGEKRSAASLEAIVSKLATHIKNYPGQRMETIGKELGFSTKELALPAKKLIADKVIKTKGQKRATTYWPRGM